MEMLIFFFISLFGGVLAAYLMENSTKSQNGMYQFDAKNSVKSTFSRLQRISRMM